MLVVIWEGTVRDPRLVEALVILFVRACVCTERTVSSYWLTYALGSQNLVSHLCFLWPPTAGWGSCSRWPGMLFQVVGAGDVRIMRQPLLSLNSERQTKGWGHMGSGRRGSPLLLYLLHCLLTLSSCLAARLLCGNGSPQQTCSFLASMLSLSTTCCATLGCSSYPGPSVEEIQRKPLVGLPAGAVLRSFIRFAPSMDLLILSCLPESHSFLSGTRGSCLLRTLDFLSGNRVLPTLSGHGKRAPPVVRIKGVCVQVCMCAGSHRMGMGGVSPKGKWCPTARRNNACLLVC